MPGFIGGSSAGSGGTGGEISFPKEFIDPVTKLRVSQPETLIDTDFEYGLQPTKWETVELINNTPSFFSKGGDTTIPNISALVTNAGTHEITVTTTIEHGLSVGIPISVTGTKSVTADGTYIINSIPNTTSFTYLCKENQATTASIEDLYTSIITGEFFQGSQIRISSTAGMTTNASATSTITVNTPSAHGFKVNTPFYFLNLNSTVSQVFDSSNSTTKSFDASNSATAQTFDGSNTLNSTNIDFSNSAVVGGVTSAITGVDAATDTISVSHSTENFQGKPIGTPLYYNVTTSSNYFATNPRGVVFLKTNSTLGTISSTFQVSEVPDGDPIDITANMTGTFQLANQARTFAGNNVDLVTEQTISIVNDTAKTFNGANTGGLFGTCTSFPGTSTVNVVSGSGLADLAWYEGTMVLYTTSGTAPSGLQNNTTYFVTNFFQQGISTTYSFSLKPLPNQSAITTISGGTGTHTFTAIGISPDRDVFHIQNHGYATNDMVKYTYPAGGKFGVVSIDQDKDFYFVSTVYDSNNFNLNQVIGELVPATDSRTGTNAGTAISPTSVTAVGFGAGLSYAVTSGTLPTGLALSSSTGVVSGTPTVAYATASVVITATDSAGTTGTQTITFQFNAPPEIYAFTTATFSTPLNGRFGPSVAQMRSSVGNPGWAATYLNQGRANGYQLWTVPATATYEITAAGARGQQSSANNQGPTYGAVMRGRVSLTQGQTLEMVVGQMANNGATCPDSNAGAGGGTFVCIGGTNTPVIVAGGGGGSYSTWGGQEYHSGQTRRRPIWSGSLNPASSNDGSNPADGQGGPGYHGGGGGGLNSGGQLYSGRTLGESAGTADGNPHQYTQGAGFSGSNIFGTYYAIGGNSNSGTNTLGGFGGGGGGHTGNNTGGGGGGYSGGPGGYTSGGGNIQAGIGGGSFMISTATNVATSNGQYEGSGTFNGTAIGNIGYRDGTGYVTITKL